MYVITNGKIITEHEILTDHAVIIDGEKIQKIIRQDEVSFDDFTEVIDANQGYISPGFIDIHSDYIESIVSPRPTSLMNFDISIREAEKILISHGITTMFHSLSIYKDDGFSHKLIRKQEHVKRLIDVIHKTQQRSRLIRHRLHARFEIDNVEEINNIKTYIKEGKIDLISFMDHTPGQGQYRDLEVYRETIKGYRDMSDDEVNTIIHSHLNKEKIQLEKIREIANIAQQNNISVASHDDDHIEKLELVKSYGTTISEFPITLDIAKKAKELGMYTIAGAPNILLGGSHSGNLSAAEAILHQTIDILCSDYYPPALLHAIFTMHEKYGIDLHKMFQLVTLHPAKAVGMDEMIGSIKENKKADIIIIEKIDHDFPAITTVMVDGKIITRTNYR